MIKRGKIDWFWVFFAACVAVVIIIFTVVMADTLNIKACESNEVVENVVYCPECGHPMFVEY